MKKYFAKLSLNSKIQEVYSVGENNAPDEKAGIEFLNKQTNYPFWVETFKDRSKRKNYAGKGMTYDEDRDAFISKQSFNSWVLNEDTCQWEAPVAYPDDGKVYDWNEETTSWEEVT
jgi:hypothetical protein|tara:strand:+ start:318 stop:665 length:348 start_codon:yes stop_codon:yes gene_type:complete